MICHGVPPNPPIGPVCLAIGFFDGVHLGHQQVIRQSRADAQAMGAASVVITFDRHPNSVVAPGAVPDLIYTLPQRLQVLHSLKPGAVLVIPFDAAFSKTSGEDFILQLHRQFGRILSIAVGATFAFGHKRSGNLQLLKKLGAELRFQVHGVPALALDGEVVSSTRIREEIRSGEIDRASQMLGRNYTFAGPVIPGDQLGRKLECPTANIEVRGLVLPPHGVYAVRVLWRGGMYPAVLNIGVRPSVQDKQAGVRAEVHLLDFAAELYGEVLEIMLLKFMRPEQKFETLDALKQQIHQDISEARRFFE
jgi:riboflavin kinase/FMN adenylyltransferase